MTMIMDGLDSLAQGGLADCFEDIGFDSYIGHPQSRIVQELMGENSLNTPVSQTCAEGNFNFLSSDITQDALPITGWSLTHMYTTV